MWRRARHSSRALQCGSGLRAALTCASAVQKVQYSEHSLKEKTSVLCALLAAAAGLRSYETTDVGARRQRGQTDFTSST